jgi:feruloyl esterase
MRQIYAGPVNPRSREAIFPGPAMGAELFMIPGMDHCFGGAGCDTFDKLGAIAHWVESGKTPERIIASKLSDGKVVRTSPLCAYPKVAHYKGTGNTEKAENFVCVDLKPAGK